MALNYVWIAFFIIAFIVAIIKLIFFGDTEIFSNLINGLFDSAKTGAELSLGLVGIMTFWLGIMKVGEKAGMISLFAKGVYPFFSKLFPGIPKGQHYNTAFALALGLDYARAVTDDGLEQAILDAATRFYHTDTQYPAHYEPGGDEYISGALTEALLMSKV